MPNEGGDDFTCRWKIYARRPLTLILGNPFHRHSMLPIEHASVVSPPSLQPLFELLSKNRARRSDGSGHGTGKLKAYHSHIKGKAADEAVGRDLTRYRFPIRKVSLNN